MGTNEQARRTLPFRLIEIQESEDLFKAMFIETVGVLFINFLNVVN